jgi:hypothetical protein
VSKRPREEEQEEASAPKRARAALPAAGGGVPKEEKAHSHRSTLEAPGYYVALALAAEEEDHNCDS